MKKVYEEDEERRHIVYNINSNLIVVTFIMTWPIRPDDIDN